MGLHWDCAAACVCEVQIEAVSLCERRDWKKVFCQVIFPKCHSSHDVIRVFKNRDASSPAVRLF